MMWSVARSYSCWSQWKDFGCQQQVSDGHSSHTLESFCCRAASWWEESDDPIWFAKLPCGIQQKLRMSHERQNCSWKTALEINDPALPVTFLRTNSRGWILLQLCLCNPIDNCLLPWLNADKMEPYCPIYHNTKTVRHSQERYHLRKCFFSITAIIMGILKTKRQLICHSVKVCEAQLRHIQ